jgi:hypothetical protein
MVEERCKHGLILGQCAYCAPPPPGLTKRVYRTAGGQVFHRMASCEGLRHGQSKAERRQRQTHPVQLVDLVDAQRDGLGACLRCFSGYQPVDVHPKSCQIRVGGQWVPGTLLRWERTPDRRWTGLVTFTVDGEVVTTTKDEADLRPAD